MTRHYDSTIIEVITRINVPLIAIFGLYVIFHGHYSPGGGFQGGVILAVSVILMRLALGQESYRRFPPQAGLALTSAGVTIFALTGLLPFLLGADFLDYGHLPLPGMEPAARRYWGILIVEVAIGVGVWGALVAIFDKLTGSRV